jgi:hypothetical protein
VISSEIPKVTVATAVQMMNLKRSIKGNS